MTQAEEWRDGRVAAVAGEQRTIVTHGQLIELGCGRRAIEQWVKRGRLHSVFHGVYSVVRGELPPLAREQAALLACGERAFLSHHTAAFIWDLRKRCPAEVEVSVVGRYRRSSKGIRVHRIQAIDRRELRHHEGLWVSSPARTLLELASTLPLGQLAYSLNEGLAAKVLNRAEVEAVLARHRGHRGAGRLAELLAGGGGTTISKSHAERRFLRLIRDAGLPQPEVNRPFGRWELDFVWREQRLVVEVDGYQFHTGPVAFHSNRDKDLAVRAAGLDLVRFTRDHVVKKSWMVLATVAGELAIRGVRGQ